MDPKERSLDKASQHMQSCMADKEIPNAWDRLAAQTPQCGFGKQGICCRICSMGPCRISKKAPVGVCGANADTIVARNFLRAICGGASAHSDHGRAVAEVFVATAKGEAPDYTFKDTVKLKALAQEIGVKIAGRSVKEIALDVGNIALAEFGKPEGYQLMSKRAPKARQEIWKKLGILPRAVDREVVEAMHRTHIGVDQDYKNLLLHGCRTSLADGWGGSMLATELQDILFGLPKFDSGLMNLGVLKKDEVNIVVHGHEPILSEMIVAASQAPDMLEEAQKVGAQGITVSGICCTANELLMRHGVPIAGNYMSQELAIATGAVEMMAVDVQCIMQGLAEVSKCYHTKLVTTADKAKIHGVEHVPMDEHTALKTAKELVQKAIDNYQNRGEVDIPEEVESVVAGFTHESIQYMLGGRFRASYRPLNDNIINGRIRGVCAIVGCTNPKVQQDYTHVNLAKELIKRDVLILTTGCATIACGKEGLMHPKKALEMCGPGLREVLEAVGIPPVLGCGSCVDNSRLLVSLNAIVQEGGLGEDISEIPGAGACLESMSEKAISIGHYCVSSGVMVVFAEELLPVKGSENVSNYLFEGIEQDLGGKWALESDPFKAAELILEHIEKKRDALGINKETERKLFDMEDRRALQV